MSYVYRASFKLDDWDDSCPDAGVWDVDPTEGSMDEFGPAETREMYRADHVDTILDLLAPLGDV
jgi:hypothetical protein